MKAICYTLISLIYFTNQCKMFIIGVHNMITKEESLVLILVDLVVMRGHQVLPLPPVVHQRVHQRMVHAVQGSLAVPFGPARYLLLAQLGQQQIEDLQNIWLDLSGLLMILACNEGQLMILACKDHQLAQQGQPNTFKVFNLLLALLGQQ